MTANVTGYRLNAILKVGKVLRQLSILRKQNFKLNKVGEKDWADIKARYKPKDDKLRKKKIKYKSVMTIIYMHTTKKVIK